MKKNLFKKQGVVTTVVNAGIGGASNVIADTIIANVDALATVDRKWINAGKMVLGAIAGSMSNSKYVHAATDGIAVVGASELAREIMDGFGESETPAPSGLPNGTVGRVTMGDRYFRGAARRGNGGGFTVSGALNTVVGK